MVRSASRGMSMTVGEYEERFRFSASSLHETFVAMQGTGPRRRRWPRFWAALALAGGIIAANEVAPRHSAHDVTHSASQMTHFDLGSTLYCPQDDSRGVRVQSRRRRIAAKAAITQF